MQTYDIIGKEVSVLVDDFKPAGKHTVIFNGENLSSGVYICLLKSGHYIGKKKIILLK